MERLRQNLTMCFRKLKNMAKFYKEFVFVIIERINMQISTFCHICDRKREFDVILMHNTGAFQISKSTKYKHKESYMMYIKIASNSLF